MAPRPVGLWRAPRDENEVIPARPPPPYAASPKLSDLTGEVALARAVGRAAATVADSARPYGDPYERDRIALIPAAEIRGVGGAERRG
jgi:hypothetical protein